MKVPIKLQRVKIKLLVLDVDGVLTDGKLYISATGIESKAFNVRDGLGLKLLLKAGFEVAIISGRNSRAVRHRMRDLGIKHLYLGVENKIMALKKLQNKLRLSAKNISYIGDDLLDLPVMKQVGFSVAVYDAIPEVRRNADYITTAIGGNGAVREVCDLLILALEQGKILEKSKKCSQ
jgi:3-deoxy-D-manno-octulosonate 8-phosphate phosphatase (KDO 8-P phosphatase)